MERFAVKRAALFANSYPTDKSMSFTRKCGRSLTNVVALSCGILTIAGGRLAFCQQPYLIDKEITINSTSGPWLNASRIEIVTGGSLTVAKGASIPKRIHAVNAGRLTVNGGQIPETGDVVLYDRASFTINDGIVESVRTHFVNADVNIAIRGGTLHNIVVWGDSELEMTSGTISPGDRFHPGVISLSDYSSGSNAMKLRRNFRVRLRLSTLAGSERSA